MSLGTAWDSDMDVFSTKKRSDVMAKIRSFNTKPEILFRSALHRIGFRFRLKSTLPGKPDMVLPKYRTAVQIRGCFWHQHSCQDGHIPHSRKSYWKPKLEANRCRDNRNSRQLRALGWSVFVVWECRLYSNISREVARFRRHISKTPRSSGSKGK